jgi:putative MATE family efflux protein
MSRPLSLTTDPIPQLIWRIAVPSSVGLFFNTMYNFVDTYCAGLLSTDALAGLSLSFPVFFVLIAVGSGLSQGATALMANALGAGQKAEARQIFVQSIILVTVVGIALSFAGWQMSPWLFRQLGARGEYLHTALAYMKMILLGGVFFLLPMTINAALAAQGNTRVYRNFLMVGFVANCVLNPVLMWGWLGLPALGVAGIALATVLIQIGGCVCLWRKVTSSGLCAGLPLELFRPDLSILRRIVAQALPAVLNMLTIALGIFVITRFVQQFGREAVAALGIATRIEQVVLMPVIGLSSAVLSIVGQNHGAGLPQRVREAWATCIRYGVALMLGGGAVVWLLRERAMRSFTTDAAIIANGSSYLCAASVTLAAYPILFGTVFLMQGLKRPAYGLWIGLYRQVLAPMIVIHTLIFVFGWGLLGIWWGVCLVNWSAALFALWWGRLTVRAQFDVQAIAQST